MMACSSHFGFWQCIRACAFASAFAAASVQAQTPADAPEGDLSLRDEQRRLYVRALEAARMEMTAKVQRIIIPEVSFNQIRFADAIEVLRRESVRLDKDSPLNRRGVKIKVEPPPAVEAYSEAIPGLIPSTVPPSYAPENIPITLSLDHPSLMDALVKVGGQVGLLVKVGGENVELCRCHTCCDQMIVREFNVPPAFIRLGSYSIMPEEAEIHLKASGVQFPPGASATYLNSTRKLVVRDTQENLDLIEALQDDFMSKPTPTPAPAHP